MLKKIVGRIGLDALDVLRHDLALVEIREHAIERDHALVVWNRLVDLGSDLANLLLRQRLEIGLDDLHVLEADQALGRRDTFVSASSLIVPTAGLSAPWHGSDTALKATRCVCLSQLATCG